MMTGVVLAGGSGTRLGEYKPLVPFGGGALVEYVVRLFRQVVDEVVVSVARGTSDRYSDLLDEDVVIVEDRESGLGPLEGMIVGFRAAAGEYTLMSPCDTPFISKDVCRTIIQTAFGRDGAVPFVHGYFEPLHGSYRTDSSLHAFERALSAGKRKPKDAYEDLDIVAVDEEVLRGFDPELWSFWNINSRTELDRANAHLESL
jgi:molybdopterin-guanine dinucleotide biosynthesis protein A